MGEQRELINIYCDESCHLENDAQPIMVFGAISCPALSVRPMLEHCPDAEILDWDIEEDGVIKTYVWLLNLDFVVIMKRMPDGSRRLLTAHCLDYENMREKLRKKYDRRLGIGT